MSLFELKFTFFAAFLTLSLFAVLFGSLCKISYGFRCDEISFYICEDYLECSSDKSLYKLFLVLN